MTRRQSLFMVELPLALPVIMAGIRTAAVWVIGTATLSTPIGQTSLGNYIFTGLQTQNWVFVLFGCVAAAVLALLVDQLLALVESGLARRKRGRVATGTLGLLLLLVAALAPSLAQPRATVVIGTKPFAEQYVLAALIEQRLRAAGLTAATREGLGSNVIFNALAAGEIDVYVDYTGTVWATQMKRSDTKPRAAMLAEVKAWLGERKIALLGDLGFENAYVLAMSTGARRGARRPHARRARGPRPRTCQSPVTTSSSRGRNGRSLRTAYGLNFREQRQMQPEFMYQAAAQGEVDVISGYTSDGRLAHPIWRCSTIPRRAIPPYDAILLLAPKRRAEDGALLNASAAADRPIDVALMRAANLRAAARRRLTRAGGGLAVERDQEKIAAVAINDWVLRAASARGR